MYSAYKSALLRAKVRVIALKDSFTAVLIAVQRRPEPVHARGRGRGSSGRWIEGGEERYERWEGGVWRV